MLEGDSREDEEEDASSGKLRRRRKWSGRRMLRGDLHGTSPVVVVEASVVAALVADVEGGTSITGKEGW